MTGSKQYPLSGVQRGFIAASGFMATTNTVPATYLIEGSFSVEQIVAAWGKVVQRHDALRTVIGVHDRTLFQRTVDLPGFAEAIRVQRPRRVLGGNADAQVQRLMDEYLAMPFDLREAPPWRGFLIPTARNRWILGLTFAHVIIDGASVGVLAQDLADALGGSERPKPLQVGPLASKEHQIQSTPAQEQFWRKEYALRKPLRASWKGNPATFHVVPIEPFPAALVEQLDTLRKAHGVSITSMLGALAGVAGRLLTGGNLMIGYATAQRDRENVANGNQLSVGALHDHLPALAAVNPTQSFMDCAVAHQARREQARQHRLPTGHLATIADNTPYDLAVNYGRFGAPASLAVRGGGTVTAVPVEAIGPVNVRRATTAAPARAFIAGPGPDGGIQGVMTGITALATRKEVARYPRVMLRIARAVTERPDASLQSLIKPKS